MRQTRYVAAAGGALAAVLVMQVSVRRDATAQADTTRAAAIDIPGWLFPVQPQRPPQVWDSVTPIRIPRGRRTFTMAQLRNLFDVPDWDSTTHPTMPTIVSHGRQPSVFACGFCHMPEGNGRPENAAIAGLSADYIIRQVHDMRTHARRSASPTPYPPFESMRMSAESVSDSELTIAATYFASLRLRARTRVVETATVPHLRAGGGLYYPAVTPGVEPLAGRLLEVAEDAERHEERDPYLGYVAYAPVGSVARGRALATRARGSVAACVTCHGPQLRGLGEIPPLAGRGPTYLVRQLLAFRAGMRDTPTGAPMQPVVAQLTLDEMVAVAAYAATLRP